MKQELQAFHNNNTWKLVSLPKGRKPIHNKWVYKFKYMAFGAVEKYKACLVTKVSRKNRELIFPKPMLQSIVTILYGQF